MSQMMGPQMDPKMCPICNGMDPHLNNLSMLESCGYAPKNSLQNPALWTNASKDNFFWGFYFEQQCFV